MPPSTRDLLHRRVEANLAAQTRVETLLRDARLECECAAAALADAQARFHDSGIAVTRLAQEFVTLADCTAISRLSLLRVVMASVPDDVLRLVFQEIVDAPDEKWVCFGAGLFNKRRAKAPFAIAAVCKTWRRVACETSTLWTYLGVAPLDSMKSLPRADAQVNRMDLLIARSKAASVDILLDWGTGELGKEGDHQMQYIMTQLAKQSLRWRRVEISPPMKTDRGIVSVLKGPTPKLEQLSVVAPDLEDNTWHDPQQNGFFPYAPVLCELELSAVGIFPHPFTQLPSLRTLRLWEDKLGTAARAYLDGAQHTLDSLYLSGSLHAVTAPIVLKRLTCLTVSGRYLGLPSVPTPLLVIPRLSRLVLGSDCIDPRIVPFLDHVAETTTHLTLFASIRADMLDILCGLRNLTSLRLMQQIAYTQSTTLDDDFWGRLADVEPSIWPRLSHVSVEPGVQVYPSGGHSITRLLTARNGVGRSNVAAADGNEEGPKLSRLEKVALDYEGVPHWVTAEVSRLLAVPPHVV